MRLSIVANAALHRVEITQSEQAKQTPNCVF
jgi:hypothetical protein